MQLVEPIPSISEPSHPVQASGFGLELRAGQQIREYTLLNCLSSRGRRQFWLASLLYGQERVRITAYAPEEAQGAMATAFALTQLRIPTDVPVLNCFMEGGAAFVVTPHLEHATLRDTLSQKGALKLEEVVGICADLAETLVAAHKAGLVHGDLDPDCVCLDPRGKPLLQWFGPGRTPGAKDPRSDMQVLGRLLRTMVAGKEITTSPILAAPALRSIRPDLPESFFRFIERAVGGEGPDRFLTFAEMGLYLELERIGLMAKKRRGPARKAESTGETAVHPPAGNTETAWSSSQQAESLPPLATVLPVSVPPSADAGEGASNFGLAGPAPLEDLAAIVVVGAPAQPWLPPTPPAPQGNTATLVGSGLSPGEDSSAGLSPDQDPPCHRCGKPLSPGAHFCRHCGRKTHLASHLPASSRKESLASLRFCNQCGRPLGQEGSKCKLCSKDPNFGGKRHEVSELPI